MVDKPKEPELSDFDKLSDFEKEYVRNFKCKVVNNLPVDPAKWTEEESLHNLYTGEFPMPGQKLRGREIEKRLIAEAEAAEKPDD